MELKIMDSSDINGVFWCKNYYVQTGQESFTLVANSGPLISDMIYFSINSTDHFIIQVGQIDRFTFFGDPNQEITGLFVDCRKGSPTLHKKVELKFKPDPTKHLYIERGIAKLFTNIKNITVRSEPIWFSTNVNTEYSIGNDRLIVPSDTELENFPIVQINELPLPNRTLQVILQREQRILREGGEYKQSFDLYMEGVKNRITIKKRS
ncbi:dTDP-4-dehydrorhamnose 3,5-epimerase [Anoxybacillus sp. UARK-01]|jgi:hypothetical protein|uniref:dTDP-4-dehydrorhamnose 3,5-epimerase family protein n=1 Tax=Anoxybacteroides rupiense TaxID=311460 RepID=A0ABD5IZ74_9BACL|nr:MULTISPECIES: dTDP-4-dehydrorhamnose 3,5-epimerase family protein [Anoxybacillus]MBB3908360.1 dTDP-4-dehydrorhamnose 3,5-epimerase [Anoxybacillus rupiensis]MED5053094.1 dTDP-4-dehydrorhamnose 3,5-epimerase family protein [Anoxybacillus rupiensis]OQM45929.1 dTDP-4-dehydrorhamnose 3,5-epimerase [Anoxybacillus sp. UARK-01]